jgi:hypothetical protein
MIGAIRSARVAIAPYDLSFRRSDVSRKLRKSAVFAGRRFVLAFVKARLTPAVPGTTVVPGHRLPVAPARLYHVRRHSFRHEEAL